jgi:hypothetical protein
MLLHYLLDTASVYSTTVHLNIKWRKYLVVHAECDCKPILQLLNFLLPYLLVVYLTTLLVTPLRRRMIWWQSVTQWIRKTGRKWSWSKLRHYPDINAEGTEPFRMEVRSLVPSVILVGVAVSKSAQSEGVWMLPQFRVPLTNAIIIPVIISADL